MNPFSGRDGVTTTSKLARVARLARTGAVTTAASTIHKARKALAQDGDAEALDAHHRAWSAAKMTRALGEMKGFAMKVGQHAAYANTGLATEWKEALSTLHQDAPSMDARTVSKVIEAELGPRAADLLAKFDGEPFAAASVGQVHRAVTPDGFPVAVKVQYPDASAALGADVDTLAILVRGASSVKRDGGGGPDVKELMQEYKDRMVQETDYTREAENLERFRGLFRDHPLIHIPGVLRDFSATRVLTMELVEGARFPEALNWSQHERDLAGETIFRFFFHSLFRLGAFNADPHPGNYLFHGSGRVTFLDFGAIWESPADVDEDMATVRSLSVDVDRAQAEAADEGRPRVGPLAWLVDLVSEDKGVRRLEPDASLSPPAWPGDVADLERITTMNAHVFSALHNVTALLATLGAVCDWGRIVHEVWPRYSYPPSTDLGELDRQWSDSLR